MGRYVNRYPYGAYSGRFYEKKERRRKIYEKQDTKNSGFTLMKSGVFSLHLTRFELAAPGVGGQCSIH